MLLVKSFLLAVKYDHAAISPLIIARLAASRVMLNLPSCVFYARNLSPCKYDDDDNVNKNNCPANPAMPKRRN